MQQIQCTHRVLPKNRRFEKILFELMVLFRTVVNRSSTFIINNTREDVNRKMKNYYVGIDMGTNSVGWATTDCEYHLLKARGQDLWGSYLFDEAEGAQKGVRFELLAGARLAHVNVFCFCKVCFRKKWQRKTRCFSSG